MTLRIDRTVTDDGIAAERPDAGTTRCYRPIDRPAGATVFRIPIHDDVTWLRFRTSPPKKRPDGSLRPSEKTR